MGGWIAIYRAIWGHWIWETTPHRFKRWVDLLMLAAWENKQVGFGSAIVNLKRGQYVTSIRRLMRRWGANNTTVTETLDLFVLNGMITVDSDKTKTIITIVNYDKYQKARKIAEILNSLDFDKIGDLETIKSKILSALDVENEHLSVQKPIPNKQVKNNNIINNTTSLSSLRENNLKFSEEFKNSDFEIEEAMRILQCEKEQILKMLDLFVDEVNVKLESHDSPGKFRRHFINWARIHLRVNKKDGNGRKQETGNQPEDQFKRRRGTDVGNHKASDYGGPFSVRPDPTEGV